MVFNPDITKQAVEVVFTTRNNPTTYGDLSFNQIPVKKVNETKHIGVILDNKLSFKSHLVAKTKKATQGIGMTKRIFPYVSRKTLEDTYKMYTRPHLDYADVLYHIPIDTLLFLSPNETNELNPQMKQLESIQYNAALAASGAWRGTSRTKLYEDLGWEPLYLRRELRRLLLFREITIEKNPPYLYKIVKDLEPRPHARGTSSHQLKPLFSRTETFKKSFFPSSVQKWNLLDHTSKALPNQVSFKTHLLKKIRPKRKEMFGIDDSTGQSWITQLRMNLSPLKLHKFNYDFQDTHNPMCIASDGIEGTEHFLLHCKLYNTHRTDLLRNITLLLQKDITTIPDHEATKILLYGDTQANNDTNKKVLTQTISFIRSSNRFSKP